MGMRASAAFNVYRKEPLTRAVVGAGISPAGLGIAFIVCVSLPLTIWAVLAEAPQTDLNYVPYLHSVSWSASIIFLFPFVVALGLRYYQEIPRLFAHLFAEVSKEVGGESEVDDFYAWLDRRFNSALVAPLALALTLVLNAIYFHQILQEQAFTDWMTSGGLFASIAAPGRGLTPVGAFAGLVQIVLIYWVINLLWRGVVVAWGLHEFFNKRRFPIKVEPLHPDGCCGFRKIGDVAMLLNLALFLLGIYVSLKVVDKIVIQKSALTADIGNPIMLGAYVILAPLLFFLPLGAAHRRMQEAKEAFLRPVAKQCERLFSELASAGLDANGLAAIQTFSELEKLRSYLRREISVWPFDFRSLQAFVGTIVIPILPVVLPFLINAIVGTPAE